MGKSHGFLFYFSFCTCFSVCTVLLHTCARLCTSLTSYVVRPLRLQWCVHFMTMKNKMAPEALYKCTWSCWIKLFLLQNHSSTWTALDSGFTKKVSNCGTFLVQKVKELTNAELSSLPHLFPCHTPIWTGHAEENKGNGFSLVWILSTWSSSRHCEVEFLLVYVTVKRWILEMETLKNKDEPIQN